MPGHPGLVAVTRGEPQFNTNLVVCKMGTLCTDHEPCPAPAGHAGLQPG